jgi:hypothetical protein
MAFHICLLPENNAELLPADHDIRLGEIVIGDYIEMFEASISYWIADDYQKHWKQAIERIVNGEAKSRLITSMYDPVKANFIFCWPIYREGMRIYFQNQMLLMEYQDSPLDPKNLFLDIEDRQMLNDEGLPVSEWEVSVIDLKDFLMRV